MTLRFRIAIALAALILMLGLGGTFHARFTLSDITRDEQQRRALALARDIESHAAEGLLTNDVFGLYRRITNMVLNDQDIRYVVLLDAAGNVKASTFPEGLPVGLRQANILLPGEEYSLATIGTSEGPILDIAYPILDGKTGVIRLGLSQERLAGQVSRLTFSLLALTGGVLLAGLAVGYLLATILTRPLSRLAEAARAVGGGDLSQRVQASNQAEVGQVAAAFNAMTERLREKEEERSRLLDKIITAQEEERKRIARELHDEAGQAITSLLLGLKHMADTSQEAAVRTRAAELRNQAAKTLDLVRDMALELRPSTLDDLGLVAALQRYVMDYGRKYGIEADFHPGALAGVRLMPQTETALYRIAQEALTNVTRHAQARNVSVLLDRRDGQAILVIEDDGVGFDVEAIRQAAPTRKLGILGMEERAALVGGKLTIESRPHSGTAIFVEVPIEASDGKG